MDNKQIMIKEISFLGYTHENKHVYWDEVDPELWKHIEDYCEKKATE